MGSAAIWWRRTVPSALPASSNTASTRPTQSLTSASPTLLNRRVCWLITPFTSCATPQAPRCSFQGAVRKMAPSGRPARRSESGPRRSRAVVPTRCPWRSHTRRPGQPGRSPARRGHLTAQAWSMPPSTATGSTSPAAPSPSPAKPWTTTPDRQDRPPRPRAPSPGRQGREEAVPRPRAPSPGRQGREEAVPGPGRGTTPGVTQDRRPAPRRYAVGGLSGQAAEARSARERFGGWRAASLSARLPRDNSRGEVGRRALELLAGGRRSTVDSARLGAVDAPGCDPAIGRRERGAGRSGPVSAGRFAARAGEPRLRMAGPRSARPLRAWRRPAALRVEAGRGGEAGCLMPQFHRQRLESGDDLDWRNSLPCRGALLVSACDGPKRAQIVQLGAWLAASSSPVQRLLA